MKTDPYARAVEVFDALMSASHGSAATTPGHLIRAANLPSTSGYRHITSLEAERMLRRGSEGHYMVGPGAIGVGLNGLGHGALAPIAQPIVSSLRNATQHTAFLGVLRDHALMIGPYAEGRATRTHWVQQRYTVSHSGDLSVGRTLQCGLQSVQDTDGRRCDALLSTVADGKAGPAVLGVFLARGRSDVAQLSEQLQRAADQVSASLEVVT